MARLSNKNKLAEIKILLDEKADQYNTPEFIAQDPISIPHIFTDPKDIETIGLIIATISWGNRKIILQNGHKLIEQMGHQPYEFVMTATKKDLGKLQFVHRTFNERDLIFFILGLRNIYQRLGKLESAFGSNLKKPTMPERLDSFRNHLLSVQHEKRSEKHVSSPLSGSACKRLNMFLRWMVRTDKRKVDFGIWKSIMMSELYLPLDVHTGRIARGLDLLQRKADDWMALEELMVVLRQFDPIDPVRYDYALFGMGVNEIKK